MDLRQTDTLQKCGGVAGGDRDEGRKKQAPLSRDTCEALRSTTQCATCQIPQCAGPQMRSGREAPDHPMTDYSALIEHLQWDLVPQFVEDEKALVDRPVNKNVREGASELLPLLMRLSACGTERSFFAASLAESAEKHPGGEERVQQLLDTMFLATDAEVQQVACWGKPPHVQSEFCAKGISPLVEIMAEPVGAKPCRREGGSGVDSPVLRMLATEATVTQGKLFKRLRSFAGPERPDSPLATPSNAEEASVVALRTLQRTDAFTFLSKQQIATVLKSLVREIGRIPNDEGARTGEQGGADVDVVARLGCLRSPVPPIMSLLRPASTLISMPFPVVVPGGRFVECYYWDTYFVIRGLSSLAQTEIASEILLNFCSCVDRFGFVPNGTRTYYLDRGQPPLFCDGVRVVVEALDGQSRNEGGESTEATTGAAEKLLWQAYPRLLREYFGFWMNGATGHMFSIEWEQTLHPGSPKKNFPRFIEGSSATFDRYVAALSSACSCSGSGSDGAHSALRRFVLNRYFSTLAEPRPESCTADLKAMNTLASLNTQPSASLEEKKAHTLRCIRAAAESGWDFSSRWNKRWIAGIHTSSEQTAEMNEAQRLKFFENIDTVNVIPCDLNAFLFQAEQNLAVFSSRLASVHLTEMSANAHPGAKQRETTKTVSVPIEALKRYISNDACLRCRHDTMMAWINCDDDDADAARTAGLKRFMDAKKDQLVVPQADMVLLMQLAYFEALFLALAAARQQAMSLFLWDQRDGIWRDFHVATLCQSAVVSAACVVPIWAGVVPNLRQFGVGPSHDSQMFSPARIRCPKVMEPVLSVRGVPFFLLRPYGIVTTTYHTGEQWDSPNVWPPLMLFGVEVLIRGGRRWNFLELNPVEESSNDECRGLGLRVARNFLESIATGLRRCAGRDAAFFEKYDADRPGLAGGGGEYPNQLGFGWTCGVVLELISRLYGSLKHLDG